MSNSKPLTQRQLNSTPFGQRLAMAEISLGEIRKSYESGDVKAAFDWVDSLEQDVAGLVFHANGKGAQL